MSFNVMTPPTTVFFICRMACSLISVYHSVAILDIYMKIDSADLQDKEFSYGALKLVTIKLYTVCPGISDPFYIAAY